MTRDVLAIVRKDLTVVWRSRAVRLPLLIVPAVILGIVPLVMGIVARMPEVAAESAAELESILRSMPASVRAEVAALPVEGRWALLALKYQMAPIYLFVPVIMASVMAADSFAGEKERGTLEALLHAPLSDARLFLAKAAGPWALSVAVSAAGLVFYAIVANVVAAPVVGRIFLPDTTWLILGTWVAPGVAVMGLGGTVWVSSRVRGFQEAYQLGGIVVVPVVLLLVGQATGVVYFGPVTTALLGLFFWILGAALLGVGARSFRRDRIATRI